MPRTGVSGALLLATMVCLAAGAGGVGATTTQTDPVTLTVTVVNADDETVGGADLTATWDGGESTATTASNGKAFLDVEAGADVEVTVDHPDYIRNHPYVVEGAGERDVTVPVAQRASLTVTVADGSGPVDGAAVAVRMNGRVVSNGETGEDGTYATDDIEAGTYSVSVLEPGYYRNGTTVTTDGDTATRVQIERGSVTLTVAVTDPHFDPPEPVGEASIRIDGVGQFTTLPEGTATVGVPVNTPLTVEVTKEGYETVTHDIRTGETALRENASLQRTPSISVSPVNRRVVVGERVVVEVTDEYGDPVAGATVRLDGETAGETDDGGQLAVPVESPGNHTLVASTADLESAPATVTGIQEGDDTTTTAEPTTAATTTDANSPGFSALLALLALLTVGLLARFRR
jgi:PGF-CTERM protein